MYGAAKWEKKAGGEASLALKFSNKQYWFQYSWTLISQLKKNRKSSKNPKIWITYILSKRRDR